MCKSTKINKYELIDNEITIRKYSFSQIFSAFNTELLRSFMVSISL